jgi:hypothetical protein
VNFSWLTRGEGWDIGLYCIALHDNVLVMQVWDLGVGYLRNDDDDDDDDDDQGAWKPRIDDEYF